MYQRVLDRDSLHMNALYNLGIVQHKTDSTEQAVKTFDRAIRIHPTDPEFYLSRAKAYLGLGDVTHAKDDLLKTLDLAPENKEAADILHQLD